MLQKVIGMKYNMLLFQEQQTEVSGGFGQSNGSVGEDSTEKDLAKIQDILTRAQYARNNGFSSMLSDDDVNTFDNLSKKYGKSIPMLNEMNQYVKEVHSGLQNLYGKKGLAYLNSPEVRKSVHRAIDNVVVANSKLLQEAMYLFPNAKIINKEWIPFYIENGKKIVNEALSYVSDYHDLGFRIYDYSLSSNEGNMLDARAGAVALANGIKLSNDYSSPDAKKKIVSALENAGLKLNNEFEIKGDILSLKIDRYDERRGKIPEALKEMFGEDIVLFSIDGDSFDSSIFKDGFGEGSYLPNGVVHYDGKVFLGLASASEVKKAYGNDQNAAWVKTYIPLNDIRFDQTSSKNPFAHFYRSFINGFDKSTDWVANLPSSVRFYRELKSKGKFGEETRWYDPFANWYDSFEYLNKINQLETEYYQTEAELNKDWYSLYSALGTTGSFVGQILPDVPFGLTSGLVKAGLRYGARQALGAVLKSAARSVLAPKKLVFSVGKSSYGIAKSLHNMGRVAMLGERALDISASILKNTASFGGHVAKSLGKSLANPVIFHSAALASSSAYGNARSMGLSKDIAAELGGVAFAAVIASESILGSLSTRIMGALSGGFSSFEQKAFHEQFNRAMRTWLGEIMSMPANEVRKKGASRLVSILEKTLAGLEKFENSTFIGGTIGGAFRESFQETVEETINSVYQEMVEEKYGLSDSTFIFDTDELFKHVALGVFLGSLPVSAVTAGLPNLRKNLSSSYRLTRDSNASLDAFIISSLLEGKGDLLLESIEKLAKDKVFGVYHKGKALPEGFKGDVNDFYTSLLKQQVAIYSSTINSIKKNMSRTEEYLDNLFDETIKQVKEYADKTVDVALGKRVEVLKENLSEDKTKEVANSLKKAMKDKDLSRSVLLAAALEHEHRGLSELSAANSIMMLLNRNTDPTQHKAVVEHIYKHGNKKYVFNPINRKWEVYNPGRHVLLADFDYKSEISKIKEDDLAAEDKQLLSSIKDHLRTIDAIKSSAAINEVISILTLASNPKIVKDRSGINAEYITSLYGKNTVAKALSSIIDTVLSFTEDGKGFVDANEEAQLLSIKSQLDTDKPSKEAIDKALNALFSLFGDTNNNQTNENLLPRKFDVLKAALVKGDKINIGFYGKSIELSKELEERGNEFAKEDPFKAFIYHSLSSLAAVSAVAPYSVSNYVYKVFKLAGYNRSIYTLGVRYSFLYDPYLVAKKASDIIKNSTRKIKELEKEKQKLLDTLNEIEKELEEINSDLSKDIEVDAKTEEKFADDEKKVDLDESIRGAVRQKRIELIKQIKKLRQELSTYYKKINSLSKEIDKAIDEYKNDNKEKLINDLANTSDLNAIAEILYRIDSSFSEDEFTHEAKKIIDEARTKLANAGVILEEVPLIVDDIAEYDVVEEIGNPELSSMIPEGQYAIVSVIAPPTKDGNGKNKAKVRVVKGTANIEAPEVGLEEVVSALRKGAPIAVANKAQEIAKLKKIIDVKREELDKLRELNESLSRQYRYYYSIVDNLDRINNQLNGLVGDNTFFDPSFEAIGEILLNLDFEGWLSDVELSEEQVALFGKLKNKYQEFLGKNPNSNFYDFYNSLISEGSEESAEIYAFINLFYNRYLQSWDANKEKIEKYKETINNLPFFQKLNKLINLISQYRPHHVESIQKAFKTIHEVFHAIATSMDSNGIIPDINIGAEFAMAFKILENAQKEGGYLSEEGKVLVKEAIEALAQLKQLIEFEQLRLMRVKLINEIQEAEAKGGANKEMYNKLNALEQKLNDIASNNDNFEWLEGDFVSDKDAYQRVEDFWRELFFIRNSLVVYNAVHAFLSLSGVELSKEFDDSRLLFASSAMSNMFFDDFDDPNDISRIALTSLYNKYYSKKLDSVSTKFKVTQSGDIDVNVGKSFNRNDAIGDLYYFLKRLEDGNFLEKISKNQDKILEAKNRYKELIKNFIPKSLGVNTFLQTLYAYSVFRLVKGFNTVLNDMDSILESMLTDTKIIELEELASFLGVDYETLRSNYNLFLYNLFSKTQGLGLNIELFNIDQNQIGKLDDKTLNDAIEALSFYLHDFFPGLGFGYTQSDVIGLMSMANSIKILSDLRNTLGLRIDPLLEASYNRASKINDHYKNSKNRPPSTLKSDNKPATQENIEKALLEAAEEGGLLLENENGGYKKSNTSSVLLAVQSDDTSREEEIIVPYGYFKNLLIQYYENAKAEGKLEFMLTSEQEYMLFTLFNSILKGDKSEIDIIQASAGSGKTTMVLTLFSLYDMHLQNVNKKKKIGILTPFPKLIEKLNREVSKLGLKNIEFVIIDANWGQYGVFKNADEALEAARKKDAEIRSILERENVDLLYIDEMQAVPVSVLRSDVKIIATGDATQTGIRQSIWDQFLFENGKAIASEHDVVLPMSELLAIAYAITYSQPKEVDLYEEVEVDGSISKRKITKTIVPRILSIRARVGVKPLLHFLDSSEARVKEELSTGAKWTPYTYIFESINKVSEDKLVYAETEEGILGLKVLDTSTQYDAAQFYNDVANLIKENIEGDRLKEGASFIIYVDDVSTLKKNLSNFIPESVIDALYNMGYIYDSKKSLDINGIEVDRVYAKIEEKTKLTSQELNTLFSRAKKGVLIGLDIKNNRVPLPGEVDPSRIKFIKIPVDQDFLSIRISTVRGVWKDKLVGYGDGQFVEPSLPPPSEKSEIVDSSEAQLEVGQESDSEMVEEAQPAQEEEAQPTQEEEPQPIEEESGQEPTDESVQQETQNEETEKPIDSETAKKLMDDLLSLIRDLELNDVDVNDLETILNSSKAIAVYKNLLDSLSQSMIRKIDNYKSVDPSIVERNKNTVLEAINRIREEIDKICGI